MTRPAGLKEKSVKALFWSGLDLFCRQGLQFGISLVLVRLIAPEEFGLMAMLSLFIGVAAVIAESGFGGALIQKKELTLEETTSVFWLNVSVGTLATLALCLLAPWIAAFYKRPELEPLTRIMALNVFLSSLGAVQSALLSRDLDFRTQMSITVWASSVSGIAAVAMAWFGFGVCSLAMQSLLSSALTALLLWKCRPWRPAGFRFNFAAVKPLFKFGSFLFFSGLLETFCARLQSLVVGKYYSAKDLGFFTRADTVQQFPSSLLSTIFDRVAFPLFCSVHDDRELMRRGMAKAIALMMFVNLPIMLGMAAVSGNLVWVVLGPRWMPCVPYLQALCLVGVWWPMHVINLTAIKSIGRSDLFFRLEVIKKVLWVSTVLAAAHFSILAIAWGRMVVAAVSFWINAHYARAFLQYPAWRQIKDVLPSLFSAAVMAASAWAVGALPIPSHFLLLALQLTAGLAVYVAMTILINAPLWREILGLIQARAPSLWAKIVRRLLKIFTRAH